MPIGARKLADAAAADAAGRRLAGLLFAASSARSSTKRAGTAFAMISLGIAELVASSLADLRGVLRRRGRHHRPTAPPAAACFGITFGPQIQVYYLIAALVLRLHRRDVRPHAHAAGPHVQRRARQPGAGRVRRLQHARVRYHRVLHLPASSPASPAGWPRSTTRSSTAEHVGAVRSGTVLLLAFIGGVGFFFGPIIGAVLVTSCRSRCPTHPGLAALLRPVLRAAW